MINNRFTRKARWAIRSIVLFAKAMFGLCSAHREFAVYDNVRGYILVVGSHDEVREFVKKTLAERGKFHRPKEDPKDHELNSWFGVCFSMIPVCPLWGHKWFLKSLGISTRQGNVCLYDSPFEIACKHLAGTLERKE